MIAMSWTAQPVAHEPVLEDLEPERAADPAGDLPLSACRNYPAPHLGERGEQTSETEPDRNA
jgi:hypothetical protein